MISVNDLTELPEIFSEEEFMTCPCCGERAVFTFEDGSVLGKIHMKGEDGVPAFWFIHEFKPLDKNAPVLTSFCWRAHFSASEAAKFLRVNPQTVRRYCRDKVLTGERRDGWTWRIPVGQLADFDRPKPGLKPGRENTWDRKGGRKKGDPLKRGVDFTYAYFRGSPELLRKIEGVISAPDRARLLAEAADAFEKIEVEQVAEGASDVRYGILYPRVFSLFGERTGDKISFSTSQQFEDITVEALKRFAFQALLLAWKLEDESEYLATKGKGS